MSLKYKHGGYTYDGIYALSSEKIFEQAERRLTAKKENLEDMQNEYDLLENQTLEAYKSNIEYYIISDRTLISKSRDWLNMLNKNQDKDGNKLDKRKKYDEKDTYEFYIDTIKKLLDIESMDNVEFIDFNFGQSTNIRFEYLGHTWELDIPHVNRIDIRAYRSYGSAAFKLKIRHEDGKSYFSYVGSTYEEEELANIMKDGLIKFGLIKDGE